MSNKILVPISPGYGKVIEELGEIESNPAKFFKKPEDFKLVLFTGGEDVSPEYYGDRSPVGWCDSNIRRDNFEAHIFDFAVKHGIKMTGICRGCQFINVMSGGRMMHHITGHAGSIHRLACSKDDKIRLVNSLHHQMIVPPREENIIGWSLSRLSDIYIGRDDIEEKWEGLEVEAILIPETLCCGVQWHPEIMPRESDGYKFYYKMMEDFLSMDIEEFGNAYKRNKKLHLKRDATSDINQGE